MSNARSAAGPAGFLSGGGALGARMRAHDWAATPLGEPENWPAPLRTLVEVMLAAGQPMFVAWGPERLMLYNDGYAEILGGKHPEALGASLLSVWVEIEADIRPLADQVFAGSAVRFRDLRLEVERGRGREAAHFDFSYTPVRDEDGDVAGLFCAVNEITGRIVAERERAATEARSREVLDSIAEGFILLGPDFTIRQINAEGLRIDGRPEAEIVGRHLLEVWPDAARLPTWPAYQAAMASRDAFEVTYRHQSDLHDVWLEVRGYPSGDGLAVLYRDITARVRAEAARDAARAEAAKTAGEQAAILGQLAEGVIVTDAEGRIVFVNPAAAEMHGVARLDVAPDAYSETYHLFTVDGRPHPPAELPLARAVSGEVVEGARWVIRRPDGVEITANGGARPLRDAAGAQTGAVLTLRDETARAAAEGALRESAERLRLIVEGASDHAIVTTDADGGVTSWSAGAERIFGWNAAEAVGRDFALIFTPEDRAADTPRREMATARETGCANDERWHVRKDGGRVFMNGSAHPLHDAAGNTVGFLKIARDETERRSQHEALQRSQERLQAVLESVSDGFYAVDAEWRFTLFNAAAEAYFGVKREDVLGRLLWEMFPQGLGTPYETQMRALMADGPAFHFEAESLLRPGHFMELRATRKAGGGIAVAFSDITERRAAEARRRESESVLRAFFDTEGLYATVLELDGDDIRYVMANRSIMAAVGVTNVAGQTSQELLGRAPPAETLDLLRRVERRGRPITFEHPVRTVDGERWFSATVSPIEDAAGRRRFATASLDITDRRTAEEALRKRSEEFATLADNIPTLCWMAYADGHIYWYNRRWYDYTGTSPETQEGWGWESVHDPECLPLVVERWTHSIETGTEFEMTFPLKGADGSFRPFLTRVTPIRDEAGAILRWFGVNIDVTEQRVAEDALRDSEARFRAITETLPQIVWSTLPDGFHDYYNARWYAFTGVPEGSTDGEGWSGVFHPDDQARAWEVWRHSLETGQDYNIEYRLRRHDGVYRWVLGRARAVRDPASGEIVRWMGTCTDIQDIVEARQVLSRSRIELERLVAERTAERDRLWNLSEDLLARADYGGGMSAVSPAWTRVLGYSESELLARPYAEIIHPDNIPEVTAALLGMRDTGKPTRFENLILTADGVWKPIEWTVAPEPDGENFIAVGRDITEETARKLELERTQEQLRQAQKMEAVGQLTGGIAHDFNNLLQGITGSLDLIQKRVAQGRTGELDRFISGAMTSANRAAALTHRLLAFSRRQPLDPKPVRPNPLLASMEDLLRRTIGENIELELVLAGGLWPTLCDPNQLESAILNLVINARDAMPEGGKLTVETCNAHLDSAYAAAARDVAPGQYVCVCVTDTGTGMPPEVIERAFDPFFTTKPIGQGTGLGLSMIYGFARQSEGYSKIYSEVGQGTTIKLYLPRYRGEALDEEAPPQLGAEHGAEAGEVVVVIEDEPVVRGLIVEVLGELGYRALEASDGTSGLELVQSAPRVDLLVTDIGLPGMNGRQLVDAARIARPGLKVLFMTGYAENAAIANGFLEPGMSMITKPFALETLATRIRDIIEGR